MGPRGQCQFSNTEIEVSLPNYIQTYTKQKYIDRTGNIRFFEVDLKVIFFNALLKLLLK